MVGLSVRIRLYIYIRRAFDSTRLLGYLQFYINEKLRVYHTLCAPSTNISMRLISTPIYLFSSILSFLRLWFNLITAVNTISRRKCARTIFSVERDAAIRGPNRFILDPSRLLVCMSFQIAAPNTTRANAIRTMRNRKRNENLRNGKKDKKS